MFKPKTLEDVSIPHIPEKNGRMQCECGAWRWPWAIVDVRHIDIDRSVACDGCWTSWQRKKEPLGKNHKPKDRKEWDAEWMRQHGAPQKDIEAMKAQKRRS